MEPLKNFINGSFAPSRAIATVPVICPANGQQIALVPLSTKDDLAEAVAFGKMAFAHWSATTIKQRAAIMFRFNYLVNQHADELASIIMKENGKNKAEALADVAKGNETVEWATSLPQLAAGKVLEVSGGIACMEQRKPLGVVAAIVPFNFPFMVPFWTLAIAMVMGNCVILKPSEKVPLTMQRVAQLLVEAGVPKGVFQIVHGAVEVVLGMCDHLDISAVTFVGSSKVAEIVSTRCRSLNKRVLALGGAKNHLVALGDCDVGMAAKDVVASFAGCCGQRCMAASVLVLVGDNEALLKEIVEQAGKLCAGQDAGMVGPLIDGIAKERVLRYINESEQSGAKVLLDGRGWAEKHSSGNWVGPTVLLHDSANDSAVKDEIFGPVLSIVKVDSWEEAIAIENANPYGNAACIYTERGANANWFISRFRAGMLGINIGIPVPREPFSFGGLYGTLSKFGDFDITGDGAMEFFSNRIKITSKWTASYSSASVGEGSPALLADKASFDGRM